MREVCDTVDLCEDCCRAFQDWLSAPALSHPPSAGGKGRVRAA
jgi:hypothetical protein